MNKSEFIETIKLSNGEVFHLEYHQNRINNTFSHFFPSEKVFSLKNIIGKQSLPNDGKYKIRFLYNYNHYSIEIIPYKVATIKSISCIDVDDFNYSYKFLDRTHLNLLKDKAHTEEVIFLRDKKVTDASYANLIFFDGSQWLTPTTFLLNGTCRQRLLNEGKIREMPIYEKDIASFEYIGLINAMLDIGDLSLPISVFTTS